MISITFSREVQLNVILRPWISNKAVEIYNTQNVFLNMSERTV